MSTSQYWRAMPDIPATVETKFLTPDKLHPDRLYLKRFYGEPVYFIFHKQKRIGRVDAVPILTRKGFIDPPILLFKKESEQLVERIKDLVNQRDGTNRDVVVRWAPPANHPAIQAYLRSKRRR